MEHRPVLKENKIKEDLREFKYGRGGGWKRLDERIRWGMGLFTREKDSDEIFETIRKNKRSG